MVLMKKNYSIFVLLFLFAALTISFAQNKTTDQTDIFKKTGIDHMNAGRYGEAIDMFKKYVAANPRQSDGYYLRGLCYEKRSEFFNAVDDFRHAYQVCPDNQQKERMDIERALNRVLDVWHKQLYRKIEGHQREIAINPANPVNYLEIARSYKNLEKYDESEKWYDEYFKRNENAPVDHILNYTEVIARTRHLEKGEKILKKYIDKYPNEHRLLSNHGYFLIWLGRYKQAEQDFLAALKMKPFYQDAQNGLDRARMEAYLDQYDPRLKQKAFPIDVYYRDLKRDPANDDTRLKLVDELIKYERIEEAYKQLLILRAKIADNPKIEEKWSFVQAFRDTVYRQRISQLQEKIDKNPNDKASINKITDYYDFMQDYTAAVSMLEAYIENHPNEKDPAMRYKLARLAAWGKNWDKAFPAVNQLLEDYPDNLDYQLLKGQILIWVPRDTVTAKAYQVDSNTVRTLLSNVLEKRPDNIEAIMAMAQQEVYNKNFSAAQVLSEKAKAIDPFDENVQKLQGIIDLAIETETEVKNYAILQEGRKLVLAEKPEEAIPYYLDYISKAAPNINIKRELGSVYHAAKRYDDAKRIYDEVLNEGFDYDAALWRAKLNYATGDSLASALQCKQIIRERPEELEPRLLLGDSYLKMKMYDSARVQYDYLAAQQLDSTFTAELRLRKKWLPVTGLKAIFETFPSYISLAPMAMFYSDNLGFRINRIGSRLELGVAQFLSLGLSFYRTRVTAKSEGLVTETLDSITNLTLDQSLSTFKGHVFLTLSENVQLGVGLGRASAKTFGADDVDAFLVIKKDGVFKTQLTYQNTDAVLILYSPYLIDQRYYSQMIKFEWSYTAPSTLEFTGYYTYLSIDDGNAGNDLQLRLGKSFYDNIIAGYEYMYGNYRLKSANYYSPQNFESHSLYFKIGLEKTKEWEVHTGGKIGYVPYGSLISLMATLNVKYIPTDKLTFLGGLSMASTSRDKSSYKYFSIDLSAQWSL